MCEPLGKHPILWICAVFSHMPIARKRNNFFLFLHVQVTFDILAMHYSSFYRQSAMWADADIVYISLWKSLRKLCVGVDAGTKICCWVGWGKTLYLRKKANNYFDSWHFTKYNMVIQLLKINVKNIISLNV